MADLQRGQYVRARYDVNIWGPNRTPASVPYTRVNRNAMAKVVLSQRPRTCICCDTVIGHGELYLSVNAFITESVCTRCVDEGRCTIGDVAEEGAR